jgi:hypothetical protein
MWICDPLLALYGSSIVLYGFQVASIAGLHDASAI